MKKDNILKIVFIFLLILWVIVLYQLISTIEKSNKKMSAYVGTEVILKKDTLTIIDYKVLNNSFILENGLEIDESLVINKN